mmetsp:Transcript_8089/g.25389  ORF Transcript_8089/g.25389 Transcript_8089/m.25389 type:complete len:319 (+) Transcript_8089:1132-2088(+)
MRLIFIFRTGTRWRGSPSSMPSSSSPAASAAAAADSAAATAVEAAVARGPEGPPFDSSSALPSPLCSSSSPVSAPSIAPVPPADAPLAPAPASADCGRPVNADGVWCSDAGQARRDEADGVVRNRRRSGTRSTTLVIAAEPGASQGHLNSCSCSRRSAWTTRAATSATSCSCMANTWRYFAWSASSKWRNLRCRSLYCFVMRRYSSVSSLFCCLYRRFACSNLCLSLLRVSCSRLIFLVCCALVASYSSSRSLSTRKLYSSFSVFSRYVARISPSCCCSVWMSVCILILSLLYSSASIVRIWASSSMCFSSSSNLASL